MIANITSYLPRISGALDRKSCRFVSALMLFVLPLALASPVAAEAGLGTPDLPSPLVVPPDASVGLPFVGLDGDWLSLNVGFLLLGAAFLGMTAFNVIMWQQVRRVHVVAERRPDPRKGRRS